MKKIFFFSILLSSFLLAQSSSIYIPLNVAEAYSKGIRSYDGNPGNNYWQNKSGYNIKAEILTDSSILIGEESIKYHNNSPDTLYRLVIRLYQDISKKNAVRDWYLGTDGLNDGMDIEEILLNGKNVDLDPEKRKIFRGSTNMFINLESPILPHSDIELKIKWRFQIQKDAKIRMGNYGDGNFFVAYWYPQIAVYDDIDGWDGLDYQGTVEFYNDFSDFEFELKVPNGFLIWATGDLLNAANVLRKDIYEKYLAAQKSDETVRIVSQQDYKTGLVTADNEFNIWKFKAENVTDISFAMSRSYNWDGASVVVDKLSGRRALTDVVYKDSTIHYDSAAQYSRATIDYLSNDLPGYPYPYSHVTSFCNGSSGGGMETPMMANDGAPKNRARHIGLIFHEIAHNYFPFIMGTNERKYAWMDEGWASFYPVDVVNKYEPEYDYKKRLISEYESEAGYEAELPLIIPSYSYKGRYVRIGFYSKPASAYFELQSLLGRDLFKKAMLEYIDRWHGKHPIPLDFFFTFNNVAGEDLAWFWKPWFYEFGYPDLEISSVEQKESYVSAKVIKVGKIPTRISLTFQFDDGSNEIIEKSSRVWSDGKNEIDIKLTTSKKLTKVLLGNDYIPDVNKKNNIYSGN